ncbi:uncharacterized protein LOC123528156 [Mercenaria mercenaria]|uniref:uncharacterized protein LOC123528156 n=1 Tax=Mercenaria mercenaria TaxID=6596 RepID=UPI00234F1EC7|nr:uncharacterized protein LOC123528156 [Mercenaria mercenaria]
MDGSKFFITDIKSRQLFVFFTLISFLTFSIGIAIGYIISSLSSVSSKSEIRNNITEAIRSSCCATSIETDTGKVYLERMLERQDKMFACVRSTEECWYYGLPRTYLVYQLNGKTINIDGKLDDDAWGEVPWSDDFVDIRSFIYGKPKYDSKFKMRWDNECLYIGVYMQENDLWATYKEHDSPLYKENGLEVLLGIDRYSFNYKQIDINVLGTIMDLLMFTSPYETSFNQASDIKWNITAKSAVYFEGTVNTPGDEDKYWSMELALPFKELSELSQRGHFIPKENEVWTAQFGRSQPNIRVRNGTYERGPAFYWNWWAWQPCDAFNMHLQNRWGLIQFKQDKDDTKFIFQKWHIYKSLFDVYDALQSYKAVTGFYTYTIEALDVPPYLLSRTCVYIPDITIDGSDFNVTVTSMILPNTTAHIRSDKYVIFH